MSIYYNIYIYDAYFSKICYIYSLVGLKFCPQLWISLKKHQLIYRRVYHRSTGGSFGGEVQV